MQCDLPCANSNVVARSRWGVVVSAIRHQGTHKHFVVCEALDRSFEWLSDFGDMVHTPLAMSVEDRVYATMNGGEVMPPALCLFYDILFKKWWIGYTSQLKEGVQFKEQQAWMSAVTRLQIVIHSFEVESNLQFEQIMRSLHPLAGYKPEQTQKALDKELERRNAKLAPSGS